MDEMEWNGIWNGMEMEWMKWNDRNGMRKYGLDVLSNKLSSKQIVVTQAVVPLLLCTAALVSAVL